MKNEGRKRKTKYQVQRKYTGQTRGRNRECQALRAHTKSDYSVHFQGPMAISRTGGVAKVSLFHCISSPSAFHN